MSSLPENEFEAARNILGRYYGTLMREVAEDIVRQKDEFEKGSFGSAENIIDRHYCRVAHLSNLYHQLRAYSSREKPKGDKPLGRDEFRCFGCGHVIRSADEQCSLCGWTWI